VELLRLATAGSVDDGKSTLIGRLLIDSKAIFDDQLEAVELSSRRRGDDYVDLALVTDGLRAEREQGITIDVAYRYFATPRRKFIVADTPGHVQYTRNMVTGASTADVAVVLVDARRGPSEQSHRHAVIASLLGIPHLVVCVNKMDLVGWNHQAYDGVVRDFGALADRLDFTDCTFVPISALHGDNVVERSGTSPWYDGPALLEFLEKVDVEPDELMGARFPVQYVIRPQSAEHPDYRGYAGQVASGAFHPGDEVVVLPSGLRSTIAAIDSYDGPVESAQRGMSVTVRLADDLDVSRGDTICRADTLPSVGQDVEAMLCWMVDQPLRPGARYAIKHTTRAARAVVRELRSRLDVNHLAEDPATELAMNDLGRVTLRTTVPLVYDDYRSNRATGSFILVDEATNATAAAGMIVGPA
jgi:bifunctional enzyme CysN/CysC